MDKVPNKITMSVSFSHALFSPLDFLILEDGIDTLSLNIGMKLPLYAMYRGADKSLAWPTSQCILFDGKNISFDASLVIYI